MKLVRMLGISNPSKSGLATQNSNLGYVMSILKSTGSSNISTYIVKFGYVEWHNNTLY